MQTKEGKKDALQPENIRLWTAIHKNREMAMFATPALHWHGTSTPLWVTVRRYHCYVGSKMEEIPSLPSEPVTLLSPNFCIWTFQILISHWPCFCIRTHAASPNWSHVHAAADAIWKKKQLNPWLYEKVAFNNSRYPWYTEILNIPALESSSMYLEADLHHS